LEPGNLCWRMCEFAKKADSDSFFTSAGLWKL
jgi:hypothetical protein